MACSRPQPPRHAPLLTRPTCPAPPADRLARQGLQVRRGPAAGERRLLLRRRLAAGCCCPHANPQVAARRYMATSDLANELAKESFRFDNAMAEKQASGRPGGCANSWVASLFALCRHASTPVPCNSPDMHAPAGFCASRRSCPCLPLPVTHACSRAGVGCGAEPAGGYLGRHLQPGSQVVRLLLRDACRAGPWLAAPWSVYALPRSMPANVHGWHDSSLLQLPAPCAAGAMNQHLQLSIQAPPTPPSPPAAWATW